MTKRKPSSAVMRVLDVPSLVTALAFLGGCVSIQTHARVGNVGGVRTSLARGVDPDSQTLRYRISPLHEAAGNGHIRIVHLLLDAGADVNIRDEGGSTPLHWAARNNQTEAMKILLANGADPAQKGTGCGTPMQWAARAGQIMAIQTLLDHAVSIDQEGTDDVTALMEAAGYGQLDTVDFLLANGADVNARREDGGTALHHAASKKNVAIGRILLAHGADPTLGRNGHKVPQSNGTAACFGRCGDTQPPLAGPFAKGFRPCPANPAFR